MKKLRELGYTFLHALVILAICAFMLFGMYRIGILKTPAWLDGIFSDAENTSSDTFDALSLPEGENTLAAADVHPLTGEEVAAILDTLSLPEDFYCHMSCTLYADSEKTLTERYYAHHTPMYDVAYELTAAGITKQVISDGKTLYVNSLNNRKTPQKKTYPAGEFDWESETGQLLTYRGFYDKADDEDYSFSLETYSDGVCLCVSFVQKMRDVRQYQTYRIDLDYGIVVSAECYENGACVYSSSVTSLSSEAAYPAEVPRAFLEELSHFDASLAEEQQQ